MLTALIGAMAAWLKSQKGVTPSVRLLEREEMCRSPEALALGAAGIPCRRRYHCPERGCLFNRSRDCSLLGARGHFMPASLSLPFRRLRLCWLRFAPLRSLLRRWNDCSGQTMCCLVDKAHQQDSACGSLLTFLDDCGVEARGPLQWSTRPKQSFARERASSRGRLGDCPKGQCES